MSFHAFCSRVGAGLHSGEWLVLHALLGYNAHIELNGISICVNGNINNFIVTQQELIIS